jgi:hypothetical protein
VLLKDGFSVTPPPRTGFHITIGGNHIFRFIVFGDRPSLEQEQARQADWQLVALAAAEALAMKAIKRAGNFDQPNTHTSCRCKHSAQEKSPN